jgi:hypothetical protein
MPGSLKRLPFKKDFYAGGLVILIGVVAIVCARGYSINSLMRMGPGFFPLALGILLTVVGVLIAGSAAAEPEADERILPERKEWLGWACIIAAPLVFILLGETCGMAPAIFGCVFVAALGDREATWKSSLYLAIGVTVFGVILFSYLLHIPLPVFRWVPL